MNHMFWPTVMLTSMLFWLGAKAERRLVSTSKRLTFLIVASLLAVPGLLFAVYYTKLLGEPIWLYQFRAAPGTELAAAGVGLVAGFVHYARCKHVLLQKQLRTLTLPFILAVIISAPYIKPLIRPLNKGQLTEQWVDGVCLQSTPSTCGPASAATIVKSLGKNITEAELARECFTYAGGTENWYLVRALRKHGLQVEFKLTAIDATEFPVSAIAGVKLPQGTGHFIGLISRDDSNYTGSDPLTGRFTATLTELRSQYQFTGFFLVIQ